MPAPAEQSRPPADPTRLAEAAGLVPRAAARLIDGVLVAVVGGVVVHLALGSMSSGLVQGALAAVLTAALQLGYFAVLESRNGRTVGKSVMGLRVVGPDGAAPTLEQAVRRNVWLAAGALGLVPLIGALVGGLVQLGAAVAIAVGIANDTGLRRGWHDRFAGTCVVSDS